MAEATHALMDLPHMHVFQNVLCQTSCQGLQELLNGM